MLTESYRTKRSMARKNCRVLRGINNLLFYSNVQVVGFFK